jgi:hypothetical protein
MSIVNGLELDGTSRWSLAACIVRTLIEQDGSETVKVWQVAASTGVLYRFSDWLDRNVKFGVG